MFTASQLLDKINDHISELHYKRHPEGLYEPIEYVLSMGGKRVRPLLMLMAYNLYKEDTGKILGPATGIEVYHNYTLLHDDLMDRSDIRRGKKTVHKVWGDNAAILSGDAMLVLAYQYMAQCSPMYLLQVMNLFGQTALEICEGQQMDMDFEQRSDVIEEEYVEMIRLKTSVLLATSLKTGALLGGAPEEDANRLYDFGMHIGVAFQLQDDLLDVYGDPAVFGKKTGGDILCNKKTYLLIKALERSDAGQLKQLRDWLGQETPHPDQKIAAVTEVFNQVGVKAVCENKMREYYARGMDSLALVKVAEERKKELKNLIKYLMYRDM